MTFFEFSLLGLLIGYITGITGASGVLIMVPILSTFLDLPLHVILGTSLLVDVIVSTSVSFAYAHAKNIDIKGILWVLVGTILGSQIGSFFVVSISKVFINFALVIGMIFFGIKMWKSGFSKYKAPVVPEKISFYLKTPIGMILSGLVVGLATGIFGAGGGLTVFIILYSFLKFPIKKAVGTSSFIMLFTALSGVVGYAQNGNIDFYLGIVVGVSAAIGGMISSIMANRMNETFLSRIIGVFFIFFALVMFTLKILIPFIS